jgi:hypothetical protein
MKKAQMINDHPNRKYRDIYSIATSSTNIGHGNHLEPSRGSGASDCGAFQRFST